MTGDARYAIPRTGGRSATVTPDEAWGIFVGNQSVAEFVAHGGDVAEYVCESPTCADLDVGGRVRLAQLLGQHIGDQ